MVTRENYVASGETSALPYEVGVYTQGKVGSKAVLATMREMFTVGSDAPENMYVWDYRRSDPEGVRQHQVVQGNRRRLLSDDPEIADFLLEHPDRDLRMTTVVREPIAINLSSFFYNFGARNPEIDIYDVTDDEIIERLVAGESFSHPTFHLDWFDIEVEPMTGIDIYRHGAFPVAEGQAVYSGDKGDRHTDLLTLRLEDIARVGAVALADYYDKPVTEITKVNTGEEQPYAQRYKDFKHEAVLPKDWVAGQLNSRFAQFFYGINERISLAERWTGESSKIV